MPRRLFPLLIFAATAFCQLTPERKAASLESFEQVWRTVRDRYPDPKINGLDWNAIHDETKPLIEKATTIEEVNSILNDMVRKVGVSHFSVIPGDRYGTAPPTFGNLPQDKAVEFEARELEGGVGYIRLSLFLDPVTVMPKLDAAVKSFAKLPGIVLDLRGNPGGIAIMATGVAGFFIDKAGLSLGEMKMRESSLRFAIFPRANTYHGKLAILVDGGSASTTEIFAQGMKDMKRARIFGTRTMGAVLASDVVRLPNGGGFQFPQATYTSALGAVLEGTGVAPDVEAADPIPSAVSWIQSHP